MVKHNSYQRVQDPYKSTELHYFTQTRDSSIKFKTNHSDITSYKCRIQVEAFVCMNFTSEIKKSKIPNFYFKNEICAYLDV